jgi:signal transduction histidine kinase
VHADPVVLRQLLHNLIGNAIRYNDPGRAARVDITTGTEDLADGRVALCIADRGIGIPAGQHEAIFGSFHRAHTSTGIPGTGLGLAICRRIAERHGGTITAQDNPGGGTRITATLPAATIRRSAQSTPPRPARTPPRRTERAG